MTIRGLDTLKKFETSISVAKHPAEIQTYLNDALDQLEEYYDDTDRSPNFGLGNFTRAISPNDGSSQKLQWLLRYSGLVETHQIGVLDIVRARFTELGASQLIDQYREAKTGNRPSPVKEAVLLE